MFIPCIARYEKLPRAMYDPDKVGIIKLSKTMYKVDVVDPIKLPQAMYNLPLCGRL